jgi:hypothetical protein
MCGNRAQRDIVTPVFEVKAVQSKITGGSRVGLDELQGATVEDPPVIDQNPQPSGPADPRPAALPGAAVRSVPNKLRSRISVANASRRSRSL